MNASIDFSGVLEGSIAGEGGGGSEVVITPVVTSGTKIADVSVDGVEKDLYCPTPATPQEVVITPVVTSGTKIADVSVDGVEKDLYCPTVTPTEVTVTQVQQSGTKIATIEVNGVNTDLYAPESDGDGEIYSTTERKIGTFLGEDLYRVVIEFPSELNFSSGWNTTTVQHNNLYKTIFDAKIIGGSTPIAYNVDIASNDPTYIEIAPSRTATNIKYLTFKYVKNS